MRKKRKISNLFTMHVAQICVLNILIVSCVFQHAIAAEKPQYPILSDKFYITVGAIRTEPEGDIRATEEGRRETSIDLKRLDADDDDTNLYVATGWRFAKRWLATFEFVPYETDGSRTANYNFNFGDLVVAGNANVRTDGEIDIYIAQLIFFPIQRERYEIGLGIGAYVADLEYEISATLNPASATPIDLGSDEDDFIAPLPVISGLWHHGWTDRLSTAARISWLDATYDDYDGELWAGSVRGEFATTKRTRLGLGYSWIEVEVEDDGGSETEEYDIDLKGPFAYFKFGW